MKQTIIILYYMQMKLFSCIDVEEMHSVAAVAVHIWTIYLCVYFNCVQTLATTSKPNGNLCVWMK